MSVLQNVFYSKFLLGSLPKKIEKKLNLTVTETETESLKIQFTETETESL